MGSGVSGEFGIGWAAGALASASAAAAVPSAGGAGEPFPGAARGASAAGGAGSWPVGRAQWWGGVPIGSAGIVQRGILEGGARALPRFYHRSWVALVLLTSILAVLFGQNIKQVYGGILCGSHFFPPRRAWLGGYGEGGEGEVAAAVRGARGVHHPPAPHVNLRRRPNRRPRGNGFM